MSTAETPPSAARRMVSAHSRLLCESSTRERWPSDISSITDFARAIELVTEHPNSSMTNPHRPALRAHLKFGFLRRTSQGRPSRRNSGHHRIYHPVLGSIEG